MAKGSHIHAFALNRKQISEYVDLSKVENRSLWRYSKLFDRPAYALAELGFAPQACQFNMREIVGQKSCIIFVPRAKFQSFPWDVYLNSRLVRYVFGLVLRSALFEGEEDIWRSHINSDAVKKYPVAENLFDKEKVLVSFAEELRTLAKRILDRWQSIDEEITRSDKIDLALIPNLFYNGVSDFSVFKALNVKYEENNGIATLRPVFRGQVMLEYVEGDADALKVVYYMMNHPEFALTPRPNAAIPKNYTSIAEEIRNADLERNPDVRRFKEVMGEADAAVFESYGLSKEESDYISARLESPPFTAMQPRWP